MGPGSSLQRQPSGWAIAPGSSGAAGAAAGTAASGGLSSARPGAPSTRGPGQGHSQLREGDNSTWREPRAPEPRHWPQTFGVPGEEGTLAGLGDQGLQQPDAGQPAKTRLSLGQAVRVLPGLLATPGLHAWFFSGPRLQPPACWPHPACTPGSSLGRGFSPRPAGRTQPARLVLLWAEASAAAFPTSDHQVPGDVKWPVGSTC